MKQILQFISLLIALLSTQQALAYDFEVDGICYTVTSFENNIVKVDGLKSTLSGIVELPSSVTYNSKTFSVTCIASVRGANIETIKIPYSIDKIEDKACYGTTIKYILIPDNVSSIGSFAFQNCNNLESVQISKNVSTLAMGLFQDCKQLKNVKWNPTETSRIWSHAFENCSSLKTFTIPSSCNRVGANGSASYDHQIAFENCSSLDSVIIEDGAGKIAFDYDANTSSSTWDHGEFYGCPIKYLYLGKSYDVLRHSYGLSKVYPVFSLQDLVIGDSVESLDNWPGFKKKLIIGKSLKAIPSLSHDKDLEYIKIRQSTPPQATGFSNYIYINTILYVPKGAKNTYESTNIWKNFWNIQEFDEDGGVDETKKCEKPTISYTNGKLTFSSATEGATCQSTITDSDITSYSSNEVQLGVTYNISVYASKAGFDNSDTATATLCWIDVEPKTEGIENGVAQVRANAMLIQTESGRITVSGADDGTNVSVYSINGVLSGTGISRNGSAAINTSLQAGSVAIIKIGEKSVKIVVK